MDRPSFGIGCTYVDFLQSFSRGFPTHSLHFRREGGREVGVVAVKWVGFYRTVFIWAVIACWFTHEGSRVAKRRLRLFTSSQRR